MLDAGTPTFDEFKRGAKQQARIVGALMMREMRTRFGERRLGYAWAIIEPLVQIWLLVFIFSLMGRRPPLGTSFEMFFLNGYIPYMIFSQITKQAGAAVAGNRGLLSFPPVKNLDTVWARVLLEVATGAVALIMLMMIFASSGLSVMPNDPIVFVQGYLMIALLAVGVGMVNAVLSSIMPVWSTIMGWITRLQYFVAGIFFLPDHLPPAARHMMGWNPVAHGIIWIREGFYRDYHSIVLDRGFLATSILILLLTGFTLERQMRRRIAER